MSQTQTPSRHQATLQSITSDLKHYADELALTADVLQCVLPDGRPHEFETQMWDYKVDIPRLGEGPYEEEKANLKIAMCDLMKDVVSFHNAYGGYIVFGVANKGRSRVVGLSHEFDVNDFNKRLTVYVDADIECYYAVFEVHGKQIGLLLVPRRHTSAKPVKFRKAGPSKGGGKLCFNAEVYVRVRDECRPAAATSEDWHFLHSDRAPPESSPRRNRRAVRASLPARDLDLVKFVGRERQLADLRNWIDDFRSPVRLLTGIGGLGKTTLAYRFAEEVVSTGAGEIEWVIWLSAKVQTFSALKGKLVSLARVDFSDVRSLYAAILSELHFDLEATDDEVGLEEYLDRLAEAFEVYSCLVIVDDIDSLTPDDQKEAVSGLFGLAMRTVGRDQPPVRVLMTSRIDQGLPKTSVVKVQGLEGSDFSTYVNNLCDLFQVGLFSERDMADLYNATSGSPLFASSVVRLISLGASRKEVIDTWRGQDGEDVRKFAFEREITRLDSAQGRLLYATVLLGDASITELAQILNITAKVARDRVSELQSYHLLSTSETDAGDVSIVAAGDLSVIASTLRNHLGAQAKLVEDACARVAESSGTDVKAIGVAIRQIISLWGQDRNPEALIQAERLKERFSMNADVLSILGAAYMRVSPPRSRDADIALEAARRLGCNRPEVIRNLIAAKSQREDWDGLYALTKSAWSNDPEKDDIIDGFVLACAELIKNAKARGQSRRAAELTLEVVEQISSKIKAVRMSSALFERLQSQRYDYARSYMHWLDIVHPSAGDKLHVFEGLWRLVSNDVYLSDLIRQGIGALKAWWINVESRPLGDSAALALLSRQVSRLDAIERKVGTFSKVKPDLVDNIRVARLDLAYRGAQVRARIS